MLRVQVNVNNHETHSELHIRNVGGDDEVADYIVNMYDGPWKMDKQPLATAKVQNHRCKDGAWWLIYAAIIALTAQMGGMNLRG